MFAMGRRIQPVDKPEVQRTEVRTKLDTPAQIQKEIKRLYRKHANRTLSASELKTRVATLEILRNGMPKTTENTGDFEPATFLIVAVPVDHYLTSEQITALKEGRSIIDVAQCRPLQIEDAEQTNKTAERFVVDPVAEPQRKVEPSRRELRNAYFRPEFHDLPVAATQTAPPITEQNGGDPAAETLPVEDYHAMLLRKAFADEAAGRSVIMREPRRTVRWPKPDF